jgi:RHS repeat-associated protein
LHRDYQGSILAITDATGTVVEKRLFDAWGEVIKVQDGAGNTLAGLTILDRGYTGHEHLQSIGIIHMNGRLYDPKLHRFLQPDNYVQDPFNTQNFNRYGYCWNNPLKYTDPSGEWIHILIGAVIGGVVNWATHGCQFNMEGLKAFGIGAGAGAIGALTGGAAFAAAGGAAGGVGGALAGAYAGAVGAAYSQAFLSMGNSIVFGDPMISGKEFIKGIAFGAVLGGLSNGIAALSNGRSFWNGTLPNPQVSPITLPSSIGVQKGQVPEIKSDAKLPSSTQSSTAPTTQNNTATAINKELGVVDVSKNPSFRIVDDGVSKNVQDALNTLDEIKQAGGTVKINPMNPNQELNMTIKSGGQKLDLRIESHKLPVKFGGNGIDPTRHMNVDIKGINLPNKGHIILE